MLTCLSLSALRRPPVASFYNPGVPRVAAGFHSTPRVMAAASGPADRSQDACDPASGAGSVMPGSAKVRDKRSRHNTAVCTRYAACV